MGRNMMKQTLANLTSRAATEPLTRWLISAANDRRTLPYSEIKRRLETECDFGTIFTVNIGKVAGAVIDKILEQDSSAPLLNVLVVRQDKREPGDGARPYLTKRFPRIRRLKKKDARARYPDLWTCTVNKATKEVYAYRHWESLYEDIYGKAYKPDPFYAKSTEKDGLRRGRGGEGENHKALRLWVKNNPERIDRRFQGVRAETEKDLLSGDRVDVVLYDERKTIAIEVKSRDSNWADLQRGIYQCVKYKAVLSAQDDRLPVESWLITETTLDGDLKGLAKKLGVKHKVISLK